jgi:hypothetical protein
MATYAVRVEPITRDSQTSAAQNIAQNPVIRLEGNATYRAKRRSEVIQVVSGCAWITFDGQDWLVYGGEEIALTPGKDDVVIGSLNGSPLVFAIIG